MFHLFRKDNYVINTKLSNINALLLLFDINRNETNGKSEQHRHKHFYLNIFTKTIVLEEKKITKKAKFFDFKFLFFVQI